jgi:hypothetical protein
MLHFIPHEVYLAQRIPLAGVAHQGCTCHFGTDPISSVLDVKLQDPRPRQSVRAQPSTAPAADRDEGLVTQTWPSSEEREQLVVALLLACDAARRLEGKIVYCRIHVVCCLGW